MTLSARFANVRSTTLSLCQTLEPEDFVVQSMPDVSPAKWHLAHTTWFFEQFLLLPYQPEYRVFDEQFHYLFNSSYYSAGSMHPRPRRGLLSRPVVSEIFRYRDHVDEARTKLILSHGDRPEVEERVGLGLNHEQQHQELLLTDIKHVFSCHPDLHAVNPGLADPTERTAPEMKFAAHPGGVFEIGAQSDGFCFDNETPRHETLVQPFAVASRLVTNGEYLEFIQDNGYGNHALWLSDGWAAVQQNGWNRPLYWSEDREREFTLAGDRPLDRHAPVTHVSYYEADAFARWAGHRLPTEAEWELTAANDPVEGNMMDANHWHPVATDGTNRQFYGDAWEWTSSPYGPYPGFKPLSGSLGEYNGKFMCNQMTVRGASCVTANDHVRASYRSFFYPDARWQFLGIRLATNEGAH